MPMRRARNPGGRRGTVRRHCSAQKPHFFKMPGLSGGLPRAEDNESGDNNVTLDHLLQITASL